MWSPWLLEVLIIQPFWFGQKLPFWLVFYYSVTHSLPKLPQFPHCSLSRSRKAWDCLYPKSLLLCYIHDHIPYYFYAFALIPPSNQDHLVCPPPAHIILTPGSSLFFFHTTFLLVSYDKHFGKLFFWLFIVISKHKDGSFIWVMIIVLFCDQFHLSET